ncbi:basic salivary proline-rich protein 1-like [Poecile atricapillus]|uniref:basic salivary proline-rich protein 1-like n=1 Tax=Poecile atricapillus TaxID=48891 RepID=UPI002739CB14|nr:basic salivary proline-rich protein 1-like [Poecile atricapillus]
MAAPAAAPGGPARPGPARSAARSGAGAAGTGERGRHPASRPELSANGGGGAGTGAAPKAPSPPPGAPASTAAASPEPPGASPRPAAQGDTGRGHGRARERDPEQGWGTPGSRSAPPKPPAHLNWVLLEKPRPQLDHQPWLPSLHTMWASPHSGHPRIRGMAIGGSRSPFRAATGAGAEPGQGTAPAAPRNRFRPPDNPLGLSTSGHPRRSQPCPELCLVALPWPCPQRGRVPWPPPPGVVPVGLGRTGGVRVPPAPGSSLKPPAPAECPEPLGAPARPLGAPGCSGSQCPLVTAGTAAGNRHPRARGPAGGSSLEKASLCRSSKIPELPAQPCPFPPASFPVSRTLTSPLPVPMPVLSRGAPFSLPVTVSL